jgi:hypothetical protein
MMPHALQTDSLPVLKDWAVQHCRNAIEDAILFYAPDHFSWEDCDEVEGKVLSHAKKTVSTLTVDLLKSLRYINCLIDDAVADTRALLRQGARK